MPFWTTLLSCRRPPTAYRTDCRLSVPRKTWLTSETVTFSLVARLREPGSKRKSPTTRSYCTCNHSAVCQSDKKVIIIIKLSIYLLILTEGHEHNNFCIISRME